MARRTRRQFLQLSLAGVAAGLAGCGMPGGEEGGGGEEGSGGEEEDSRDASAFADE